MCSICGIFDMSKENRIDRDILLKMNSKLEHRGPDESTILIEENLGMGYNRLSIIDLKSGMQPIYNEDGSIILICNGEIFNYKELRESLTQKGHRFHTASDCECIIHLYEEYGNDFLNKLNGQFAFCLYDSRTHQMLCARDYFGIAPLFYTIVDGLFIFASEIKAIIEHPYVERKIDMVGLDQVMTFPGLISPRTMFKNISSLKPGHMINISYHHFDIKEYWDLVYPKTGEIEYKKDENYYIDKLDELLTQSIKYRLQSDVPVGFYVSGGLDSSLIAGKINKIAPYLKNSFSIEFMDKDISEAKYQKVIIDYLKAKHNAYQMGLDDIVSNMEKVVYHAECALKESYNTATMKLAEMAHNQKIKVVLTGEGADELFGGYIGYRFDLFNQLSPRQKVPNQLEEEQLRYDVWGDSDFLYEKNFYAYNKIKKSIYSESINEIFDDVNCLNHFIINKERIKDIDILHKRSYVDFKLRMADHLLGDHGDRMEFSHSVEARFPFLDKDVVEFVAQMPPNIKLKNFDEKYILKKISKNYIPEEIVKRPKFAFTAPGSSEFLKSNKEYIEDMLSYERIKRHGIFNPSKIEQLKQEYSKPDFKLNVPYDNDYLMVVLTTEMLFDKFGLEGL